MRQAGPGKLPKVEVEELAAFTVGSSVIVALRPGKVVDTMAEVLLAIATVATALWMISLLPGYQRHVAALVIRGVTHARSFDSMDACSSFLRRLLSLTKASDSNDSKKEWLT